jgi:hypothetical protein
MDPIYIRGVERILIVLAGILSVFLGYKLFSHNYSSNGELNTSKDNFFSFSIKNVGPGVFFALFGMVLLGLSVRSPYTGPRVKIESMETKLAGEAAGPKYMNGQLLPRPDKEVTMGGIHSINIVVDYLDSHQVDPKQVVNLKGALEGLNKLRRSLVDMTWGRGAYDKFLAMNRELAEDSTVSNKWAETEKKAYEEIRKALVDAP